MVIFSPTEFGLGNGGGNSRVMRGGTVAMPVDTLTPQLGISAVSAAGSIAGPSTTPAAIGASTLYGISSSNYGLGSGAVSTQQLASQARVQANMPSLWWLVAALLIVAVFTHE